MRREWGDLVPGPCHDGRMTDTTAAYVADLSSFIEGAPTPFHAVEQVGEVLASTMPAVVKALGKGTTGKNDLGFGRQLRNLNA